MSNDLLAPADSLVPVITNKAAAERFRTLAHEYGFNPDNPWVGGYVEYEWGHVRHILEAYENNFSRMHVLEVGCNVGASAIVMAKLGAKVTAIDINENIIFLAKANAEMYGMQGRINFLALSDSTRLPFDPESFDIVNCNSVLEYVPHDILRAVQREIDRVLKLGGRIFVSGTSNRLWPIEMHSQRWLVNYLPRFLDNALFGNTYIERGVSPRKIRYGFGHYRNLDWEDKGKKFIEAKSRMGVTRDKLRIFNALNILTRLTGLWMGFITPSLTVTLQKK